MKISFRLLSFLSLSFVLQGCEMKVDGGRIPPKYIPAAQKYAGTYVGDFDGRHGTIVLALKDDGYVEVTTPGFEGGDILDVGCGSSIGPLLRIDGKQSKSAQEPVLESLFLGFHHKAIECISHNEIEFDFGQDAKGQPDINASLVLFLASYGQPYTISGYFIKE